MHFTRRAGQFIYGKQNIHKGAIGIVPPSLDGFQTSQDLPAFDFLAGVSPMWFLYSVGQEQFYSALEHRMTGTGSKRLSEDVFRAIELPIPELDEQQKIADCLTSLGEVIAAQGRKVEALKVHKKGLMQHLFPQEGQTLPRLRFPEFRDGPEWEERKAGELFRNRKEDGKPGLPIYSVTVNDGMVPRASLDRDFYDIEDPAGNKKACKGDLAYNMMRMWQGAHGVAPEDCMVSPAYIVLAPLAGASSDFFFHLFKLPTSLQLLTSHSRGLTKDRLRLYFEDFARMPLRVPALREQHRIAACLSTLDARLAAETSRLDALKAHKKGLMQGLFPISTSV